MAITFKIAARTLRHLGAELITSEEMALNELMKNSFDANSEDVRINIKYPMSINYLESLLLKYFNKKNTAQNKTINLIKNNMQKYTTEDLDSIDIFENKPFVKEVTKILELSSNISDKEDFDTFINNEIHNLKNKYYSIQVIDSGIGMTKKELEEVFLVIGTPNKLYKTEENGRVLLGEKGIGRLSMMKLGNKAKIITKTANEEMGNSIIFEWDKFDDPDAELTDIELSSNEVKCDFKQGTKIIIKDLISDWNLTKTQSFVEEYIRRLKNPFNQDDELFPIDIYQNEKRLPLTDIPDWLVKQANFKATYEFTPDPDNIEMPWLEGKVTWRDHDSSETRTWFGNILITQLVDEKDEDNTDYETILRKLGKFKVTLYWFNRKDLQPSPDRALKTIRKELDKWVGGISIYRDNFRIGFTGGLNDDWLEWDNKALRGQGYTLNRYQTIGALEISKINNPLLQDTANRQSLTETSEFKILKKILGEILRQDLLKHIHAYKSVQEIILQENIDSKIDSSGISIRKAEKNLTKISKKLNEEDNKDLEEVQQLLKNQNEVINGLNTKIHTLSEKSTEILELANLGQMADIIAHELSRITENTSSLLTRLHDEENTPEQIELIIKELKKQIDATNKRIKSIDILSPASTQENEEFDITAQLNTIIEGYQPKFRRHDISAFLSVDGKESRVPVKVTMVRGLVAQILENLLVNSVYWLQQGLKSGENQAKIFIDIDSKARVIFISDNGPGIDPRYKEDIFKPYFSNKKRGKGLGLFIAAEIARYHQAKIYLDNDIEEDGRIRTFIIELPKF
ncbi:sensor histidine kinase [Acinetobacter baumannii]